MLEEASGGRMHFMANQRRRAQARTLPEGWLDRVRRAVATRAASGSSRSPGSSATTPAFRARTRGVGVLTRDTARAYGVSGPVARA